MKIFANEILLHLLKDPAQALPGVTLDIASAQEVIAIYEEIKGAKASLNRQYNFRTDVYKQVKTDLKKHFHLIEAAGGIVTKGGQILLIKRLGKWDLPKGKIDKGEKTREAAVREVEEECGVKAKAVRKVGTTWHTYLQNKVNNLKRTVWYEMECMDDSAMKPQKSEDITKVKWVSPDEAKALLRDSYNSIRYIFERFAAHS